MINLKDKVLYNKNQLINRMYLGDKKVEGYEAIEVENLVKNGDFRNGSSNWSLSGHTEVIDGWLTWINTGSYSHNTQDIANTKIGDILYARQTLEITGFTDTTQRGLGIGIGDYGGFGNFKRVTPITLGVHEVSLLYECKTNGIRFSCTSYMNTLGRHTDSAVYNLTKMFGKGNEPTKEWCDQNIHFFTNHKQGIRI